MKDKIYFLAGFIFFILGIYNLLIINYLEAVMYIALGIGFSITGILKNNYLENRKKLLEVASWIMIFISVLIFLFLLRVDNY